MKPTAQLSGIGSLSLLFEIILCWWLAVERLVRLPDIYEYGKCSKIMNTFLFLFSNKLLVIRTGSQNSKQGRPWSDCFFRSSLIWVCTVVLCIFDRQVFEILEILELLPKMNTSIVKQYVHCALTFCMLGNFSWCFVICWFVFQESFQKIFSGTLSECQTVCIQIRTDRASVLIWVQTVCKDYQQTTKVTTSSERVYSACLVILQLFWWSADFVTFSIFLSGITSECQTVWIQIRPVV